jgi:hypothetical protein
MVPVERPKINEKFASRKIFASGKPALVTLIETCIYIYIYIYMLKNDIILIGWLRKFWYRITCEKFFFS